MDGDTCGLFLGSSIRDQWTYVDVADNDRVAVGVEEILALRITSQHDRLATGRAGQCRIDELCEWDEGD